MPYTSDSHQFDQLVLAKPKALKILAEGDSWFAYPRRYLAFGRASNVVHHLAKRKDLLIYATASNGDEALTMLSGEQKHALMKRLQAHAYDYLLFSGGGNDIVGRYDLDYFIRPYHADMTAEGAVYEERLQAKLLQLSATYEELIYRLAKFSKNKAIRLVTHTYDFPRPSKKGFALFDVFPIGESWIYPIFKSLGYRDVGLMAEVAALLLRAFRKMLFELQAKHGARLTVVDTQGLLTDKHWRNEIHPNSAGFKLVTKALEQVLV